MRRTTSMGHAYGWRSLGLPEQRAGGRVDCTSVEYQVGVPGSYCRVPRDNLGSPQTLMQRWVPALLRPSWVLGLFGSVWCVFGKPGASSAAT